MMSSTTRSTGCVVEAVERLLAVASLDDACSRRARAGRSAPSARRPRRRRAGSWRSRSSGRPATRCLPVAGSYYSPRWRPPAPGAAPPATAARLARAAGQRPPLPRHLLLVVLPLLLLAFTVARPAPLQPPNLPPAFDRDAAAAARRDLAAAVPGPGAGDARARPAPRGGSASSCSRTASTSRTDRLVARACPGLGQRAAREHRGGRAGPVADVIVVMAHRDDTGAGPGANDNASGTAALIELARAYAPAARAQRGRPPRTRSSSSRPTAAPSAGSGRLRFAAHSPLRDDRRRRSTSTRSPGTGRRGSRSRATGRARRPRRSSQTASRAVAEQTGAPAAPRRLLRPADRPRLPVHALRAGRRSSRAASPRSR